MTSKNLKCHTRLSKVPASFMRGFFFSVCDFQTIMVLSVDRVEYAVHLYWSHLDEHTRFHYGKSESLSINFINV